MAENNRTLIEKLRLCMAESRELAQLQAKLDEAEKRARTNLTTLLTKVSDISKKLGEAIQNLTKELQASR